jgi:hypothetical protein
LISFIFEVITGSLSLFGKWINDNKASGSGDFSLTMVSGVENKILIQIQGDNWKYYENIILPNSVLARTNYLLKAKVHGADPTFDKLMEEEYKMRD